MLYTLEQGPTERKIIELALREGRPLPKAIQNAPELWPGLGFFFGAYLDLDTCRPSGWGPGKIPWTAADSWAARHGVRGSQFDRLWAAVRAMDAAYLDWYDAKAKRDAAAKAKKGAVARTRKK